MLSCWRYRCRHRRCSDRSRCSYPTSRRRSSRRCWQATRSRRSEPDRKRALKLYLRTITESEYNHRAWLRGCDLMRQMDFRDNAESWWRKVAELFPEHPEVLRQLALESEGALPVS